MNTELTAKEYTFRPRGIGANWLPCFVCGYKPPCGAQCDMASFVRNKEDGEAIVALFEEHGLKATLDYRDYEPDWVQVKIGACPEHLPVLEALHREAVPTGRISSDLIARLIRSVEKMAAPGTESK